MVEKIILKNFFADEKSDEKHTIIHKPLKNSKMDWLWIKSTGVFICKSVVYWKYLICKCLQKTARFKFLKHNFMP